MLEDDALQPTPSAMCDVGQCAVEPRQALSRWPQRFRQPEEQAAPRPELRRTDADARAVADLIDLVEDIHDVEARSERAGTRKPEYMGDSGVDLGVVGQMFAVGNARAAVRRGDSRRQIK